MAYDFSKGSKTIRKVGFLDGVNGSKIRPVSPFPLETSKGLVAKYFDSTKESLSATRLLDQSPLNSGTRRTGEEGRDYLYDGVDDYSTLDSVITLSGDLSLSFWAKRTDITKYHIIFNNGALLTPKVGFDISTDNLFIRFSGASVWLANSGVDTTTWNHYVITRTAGVAKAYVNGIVLGTTSTASGSGDFVFSSISTFTDQLYKGNLFDIRIYNKALSQEEVDFVYSFGKTGTNPSLPVNWWKCDEQSGTVGYDSVGGNHLTHTNITAGTFHATQNIWSFQNQVGGSPARNLIQNSSDFNDSNSWNNLNVTVTNGIPDPDGGSSAFKFTATSSSATLFTNKIPYATASQSGVYCFSVLCKRGNTDTQFANFLLRNSTTVTNIAVGVFNYGTNVLSLIGTGNYGGSATLVSDGWYLINIFSDSVSSGNSLICYIGATGGTYTAGNFAYFYAPQLSKGTSRGDYQKTNGIQLIESVVLPRDESDPTNDVLGNPLTNTGRRPNDAALHSSNCLTADGTLYIAAAHLAGTETVVSYGGTSTPSISAGRIDFTAGTCWDLTLSDGTHYKLAEGYGTLILDASGSGNHGVLTNATLSSAW